MLDPFHRSVDYLRISITDRCNERCGYCMPETFRSWIPDEKLLSYDEILRIARVAAGLGFTRFRVTGGEPLVRPGVVEFIARLAATPGVRHVAMTTNGTRLAPLARPLRDAGLRSVNISLDALDPRTYERVTKGDVREAIAGIDAAAAAGFERVKLNAVLIRGVSESELRPLAEFAAKRNLDALRFIELMPVSDASVTDTTKFLGIGEARSLLGEHDELLPDDAAQIGGGPAKYWRMKTLGLRIGFIGAMTDEHFCERCNKVRLTPDGFVRPCLGQHGEHDLKPALRDDHSDPAIEQVLRRALAEKPAEHLFRDRYTPLRIMTAIGG